MTYFYGYSNFYSYFNFTSQINRLQPEALQPSIDCIGYGNPFVIFRQYIPADQMKTAAIIGQQLGKDLDQEINDELKGFISINCDV